MHTRPKGGHAAKVISKVMRSLRIHQVWVLMPVTSYCAEL